MTALTRSAGTCSIPNSNPAFHTSRQCLAEVPGVFVAASDYVRALPDSISRWFPRHVHCLGTDGFGRSDSREALRDFFEVDARFIVLATLVELYREKQIDPAIIRQAILDLKIDPEKVNPLIA